MKHCLALALALLLAAVTTAAAQETKQKAEEMGTPEQRAACAPDVRRFCKSVKPEDGPFAYLSCLQEHQDKLRPACVTVITGGAPPPK
jgi:hypothetical protein